MYSILIADDEAIIREGIKYLLDYESLGYRICGEAATGDQTLEALLTLKPDVALVDIRMPGITGLEAVCKARAQGYTGRVVIVSSYTDFTYAQEAIRYGVSNYLTKPIEEEQLQAVLEEFKAALDKDAQDRNSSHNYRSKVRRAVLEELLRGEAVDAAQLADLGLAADSYQVVILERDGYNELMIQDHELYDHILLDGKEVLLLKGQGAISRFHQMLDFHIKAHHGTGDPIPFFACGDQVTDPDSIHYSYDRALQLHERRFFCEQHVHILLPEACPAANAESIISPELLASYTTTLLGCIQSYNRRSLAEVLTKLRDQLSGAADPTRSIRLFLTDLYLQVREQIGRLYPNFNIPFLTNAEIIRTIHESTYLYQIIRFFSQRFTLFMDATGGGNRDSVLDDILHYIHHNYAGNITLETIAPLFGYNRSYLGKIFTKKMGQNFNAYVDHVRIEKSKELLLSESSKIYLIAERVGYRNVDYFHIKFRKYVGMSPAEYRKKNKA